MNRSDFNKSWGNRTRDDFNKSWGNKSWGWVSTGERRRFDPSGTASSLNTQLMNTQLTFKPDQTIFNNEDSPAKNGTWKGPGAHMATAGRTALRSMTSKATSTSLMSAKEQMATSSRSDNAGSAASSAMVTSEQLLMAEQFVRSIRVSPKQGPRFRANENANWDQIEQNALEASRGRTEHIDVVILVYQAHFNPFHRLHVDILKRAKESVQKFLNVPVVGAIIVPSSDSALYELNMSADERMPFQLRVDVARSVLDASKDSGWVLVDPCMESCMQGVPGSITPYINVYAKARLHSHRYDTHTIDIRTEDAVGTFHRTHMHSHLYVPVSGAWEPDAEAPTFKMLQAIVINVPKDAYCNELLWDAVDRSQDKNYLAALEKFCGPEGAARVRKWVVQRYNNRKRAA